MPNTKKIKMIPILVFALLLFAFSGRAISSDLDIFDLTPQDVHPNVLIVLDLSGSMMTNKDVPNAAGINDYRLNVAKAVLENLISNPENKDIRWGLMTFPYYYSSSYVMGGGRLIAECKPRTFDPLGVEDAEPYAGTNGVRYLINTINGLSANGGTPVAAALAEAGLYMAGQGSFFWTGTYNGINPPTSVRTSTTSSRLKYNSPIENECQHNYIILVTDGFSSVDSGKIGRSYYNSNSATKYTASTWNDSIFFMDNYLPGVKIDGNIGADGNSYGYITWKSKFSGDNIGKQLEDVVIPWKWTAYNSATNPGGNKLIQTEVTDVSSSYMTVGSYNTSSPYLQWHNIISGVPLARSNRLEYTYVYQLFARKDESYIYGYNADDPSRSIPPFPVSYTTSGNTTRTSIPLYNQGYIAGTQIFQGNQWEAGNFASDYLDDVAAILYNEDLRPDIGEVGSKYEKQRVKTYVIGFRFSSDLLDRAAIMGSGGAVDKAMTADAYDELETALNTIMTGIKEDMAVFASPSLPSSGENELYTDKYLYMGLFKPSEGFWIGNLKRYTLDDNNTMSPYLDANGAIKSSAISDWGSVTDGNDVSLGGAAAALNVVLNSMVGVSDTKTLRRIYTFTNSGENDLTKDSNLFIESNSVLLPSWFGLSTSAELKEAITKIRLTPMGAVMHSTPTLIRHGNDKVVYIGANDGFLHAFYDQDSHVSEAWAFVMPQHFETITTARETSPSSGVYFVDGSIAYKTVGSEILLVVGARRGGDAYYVLNVDSFNSPKYKYVIDQASVGWNIGQSWGTPRFIDGGEYMLLPGGYDYRYDTSMPENLSSVKGAGIIGLTSLSGVASDKFHSLHGNMMQHSILDLTTLDTNSDGYTDTLYYGDLGGRFFYASTINHANGNSVENNFEPYLLFKTDISSGRKFMDAPAVLQKSGVQYVYFGSGDRETPLDKQVQNRFYCVKNDAEKTHLDTSLNGDFHLTDAALYNASANLAGSDNSTESENAKLDMDDAFGWYINLREGEKVTGTPAAYDTLVIFTTYQPLYDELPDPTDVCASGSSTGEARLYIIDYLYATGTLGNEGDERSQVIGNTIPSAPVLSIFQVDNNTINVKVTVTVGVEDIHGKQSIGVPQFDLGDFTTDEVIQVFYWREIF